MLELIRQWLLGITAAAMLVALAEALCPDGNIRGILRLTGGLVLLAALPSRFGMAGFLIAAVPVALAFGGTIPQLAALIMAFFGPRHFGVDYGFSTSPLMVASVCGPFIGGLIRAWSGDYLVALYVAAAITLLGVAPAVVLREKAHKRESVAREGCPSPASLSSQNG